MPSAQAHRFANVIVKNLTSNRTVIKHVHGVMEEATKLVIHVTVLAMVNYI